MSHAYVLLITLRNQRQTLNSFLISRETCARDSLRIQSRKQATQGRSFRLTQMESELLRYLVQHPGQAVSIRYDAFPYQRYGVRFATVRWLGPAGSTARDSGEFRALVDLADDSIRVHGQLQALLPGMGGRADIVVGRRSLISYAFEPIRALRENFAEPPAR